jgi:hypothetical protein
MHHHNVSHGTLSIARYEPVFQKCRRLVELIGLEEYKATVSHLDHVRDIEFAIDQKLAELKQEAVNG